MQDEAVPAGDAVTITEMSRRYGVSQRTLRFYEEMGLLNPRRAGHFRVYSSRDEIRLQIVLKGKRLGFTLRDIDRMIQSRLTQSNEEPAALDAVMDRATVERQLAALESQRADIEAAIAELRARTG